MPKTLLLIDTSVYPYHVVSDKPLDVDILFIEGNQQMLASADESEPRLEGFGTREEHVAWRGEVETDPVYADHFFEQMNELPSPENLKAAARNLISSLKAVHGQGYETPEIAALLRQLEG